MAREGEATGKLTLKADFQDVPKAAAASAASMTKLEQATKGTGAAVVKTESSMKQLADTTKRSSVSLDQMRSQTMASLEILRKAVGAIDMITEATVKAGGGSDIFTRNWIALKKAMDDPQFFDRVGRGLADTLFRLNPLADATERAAMAARGDNFLGDNRRGVGLRGMGAAVRANQAAELREQANLVSALLGSLQEGERVRQEHLKSERGITAQLKEQKVLVDTIAESHRENELARLQAARDLAERQREEPFEALEGQFEDARAGFEQVQAQKLEAERIAQHEAELQRFEELKQAETERLQQIEFTSQMAEQAASTAVAGIIDITSARRDAIRAAKLQGATDREAAQAGKVATMVALEGQLKSLRNMATMHVIEYTAKGIASQASTYGIPNPQSVGYFTAAGVMGGIAVASGIAGFGVGAAADSMRMGGGGGAGFGGGFGGAGTGGGGGGAQPRSGPSPIDSDIPGSPIPQPTGSSSSQGGGAIVHFNGPVHIYGAGGRKQFVEDLDRDLAELGHFGRRAG